MAHFQGLPALFAHSEARGIAPGEPVAQWEIGGMKNFTYAILDWSSRRAAWIDPHRELADRPDIWAALEPHGFQFEAILLTHTHHDHVGGVEDALRRHPEALLYVHFSESHRIAKITQAHPTRLRKLEEGTDLKIGAHPIEVRLTPGHSAGECCFRLRANDEDYCFTGDTLFIRDCGRTDLPTGSDAELFKTLQEMKTWLTPNTIILPGHHYQAEVASRFGDECERSPPLLCRTLEEFRALP